MNLSRVAGSLHVYTGLFLVPLAALFAISVFVINHAPVEPAAAQQQWERTNLVLPDGLASMTGRERIDRLRPLLDTLGVRGEVGFVRYSAGEDRMVIPVTTPVSQAVVDLRLRDRSAVVTLRAASALRGTVYLHKLPGPHLVNIRGNWPGTRLWRVVADATVYLILFTTLTGIWIWWLLRPLRMAGLAWLAVGTILSLAVLYALID